MCYKKDGWMLAFALLLCLFVFLSCSKKGTSSKEKDQSAILSLIVSNPDIFSSRVIDTAAPDTSGLGKIHKTTADTVKAWWRRII